MDDEKMTVPVNPKRRRRVPGIGWFYLAGILGLIRLFTGMWRIDGGWLLVFVFTLLGFWFMLTRQVVDQFDAVSDQIDEVTSQWTEDEL